MKIVYHLAAYAKIYETVDRKKKKSKSLVFLR